MSEHLGVRRAFQGGALARLFVLALAVLATAWSGAGSSAAITASHPTTASLAVTQLAATASPAPASSSQLVTVNAAAGSSYATLSAWQRGAGGNWVRVFGPLAARVGANGIGPASEGSSYTPRGTFPLNVAFGRRANPATAMPYFQTDPADWWDENPASPTYNMHVRRSSSPGGASENLYDTGTAYNYAVNIGYNLARTPGAGSAFFLHVNTGESTAGCVSIDETTLAAVLRWLTPAQHPYIDIRIGAALSPTPQLSSAQATKAVNSLYRGILGRDADASGLVAHRTALLRGTSMATTASSLVRSTEYLRRQVAKGYRQCLGRTPDAGGMAAFTVWLAHGGTLSGLFVRLCGSTEAWSRSGGDPKRWLALVYRATLGRAPTVTANVWLTVLARSGRAAAAAGITTSHEFGVHQLDGVYRSMLGRGVFPPAIFVYAALMPGRGIFAMPVTIAGGTEFWAYTQR